MFESSIWSAHGFDNYILEKFPEINELNSTKLKKQARGLATVTLLPPETVIASEGTICDEIHLVVGGKVDLFCKIK